MRSNQLRHEIQSMLEWEGLSLRELGRRTGRAEILYRRWLNGDRDILTTAASDMLEALGYRLQMGGKQLRDGIELADAVRGAGPTAAELAIAGDVSAATASRFLRGQQDVCLEVALAWLEYLRIAVSHPPSIRA